MALGKDLDFEVHVFVKGEAEPVVFGGTFPDSVIFIRGEPASLEVNKNVYKALQSSFDQIRATMAAQMSQEVRRTEY